MENISIPCAVAVIFVMWGSISGMFTPQKWLYPPKYQEELRYFRSWHFLTKNMYISRIALFIGCIYFAIIIGKCIHNN
jgi:hypothetical protein